MEPAPDRPARNLLDEAWRRGRTAYEAGDYDLARRWQDRARRLAPGDQRITFGLATTLFQIDELSAADALFKEAARTGAMEALLGSAACAIARNDAPTAVPVLQRLLSGFKLDLTLPTLAGIAADALGLPGWCGLLGAGKIQAGPGRIRPTFHADGVPIRAAWSGDVATLPRAGWDCDRLDVELDGIPLLGSPLRPAALHRTEGVVELWAGDVTGWAWLPADPAADATLTLRCGDLTRQVTARGPAPDLPPSAALSRARSFRIPAADLADWPGPVHVLGQDGKDLLGSPVDPMAEWRGAASLARAVAGKPQMDAATPPRTPVFAPIWADVRGLPIPVLPMRRPPVDIVIPVYRGERMTLDCLASVRASLPRGSRIHVVEDASPEPGLVAALAALARQGRIRLIRNPANLGFPGSVNAGLRACAGRDAVVLNSDTLVPPGWIERLRAAAYGDAATGSVTPLSNDATICSYPGPGSPAPSATALQRLDRLAQRANGARTVEIPTGIGFCWYLRHDCLAQVGLLREDVFAQGYGEENDWCRRAAVLGWRHVAAPGVFVAHLGSASFGAAKSHLIRRNLAVLNRLHPGYDALVARWVADDPLLPARRRIDQLAWPQGTKGASVILITHGRGGGVERAVRARCAALQAEGVQPVILHPKDGLCVVSAGPDGDASNLRYRLPGEWRGLVALLRGTRPSRVELHHMSGHDPAVLDIPAALGVPMDVHVHDYAAFCPRIALVSTQRRYCGEPDVTGCEDCIADLGSKLEEPIGVRDLVARSTKLLGAARRVIVPSADVAVRMRRHFPELRPDIRPWEEDALAAPNPANRGRLCRILVPGAIGVEKGLDVLVACARDARSRSLPLEFVVCGYTADDARLLDAGPVHITGEYASEEAEALFRAQRADLAFIPSVWPETWCFTLSEAWQAGLPAAVFDLGTPAERVRRTGRGWILPLGLSTASLNDSLIRFSRLAAAPAARHSAAASDS